MGFQVTVIGCSGSFAGPLSPASCYLVESERDGVITRVVLDLGSGALGVLQRHTPLDAIDAIFLTHLHPDHCVDVLGLYVARHYRPDGRHERPLALWGPADSGARLLQMYHGMEVGSLEEEFALSPLTDRVTVTVGSVSITPYAVNHPVEAFGFRVTDGEAVLAYTGDTDTCDALTPLLTGADVALVDCAFVDGRDLVPDIHLSGSRAARAALAAGGVRRLILTHIPAWNDPFLCRAQAAEVWPGELALAHSGMVLDVHP